MKWKWVKWMCQKWTFWRNKFLRMIDLDVSLSRAGQVPNIWMIIERAFQASLYQGTPEPVDKQIQISDNNQKNHFKISRSILFQVLKKWGRRESERYAKREADPTISEPGTGYSSLKTIQNTIKASECSREWSSQWMRIRGEHIEYTNNGQASICIYCGCSLVFLRQLCWELTAGRTRFADTFQIWKFKGPKKP